MLLRRVAGRVAAASGCGLLGLSYGYWWYSVEAEVYILSTLLLVCSLLLPMSSRTQLEVFCSLGWGARSRYIGAPNECALRNRSNGGTLHCLAIVAVGRCNTMRAGLRGAGIAIVVPSSVLAFAVLRLERLATCTTRLTLYAQPGGGSQGIWSLLNIPKAVFGFGRALVGGHFVFALEPSRKLLLEAFPSYSLREEEFLVRNFPDWLILLLLALSAVVIVALLAPVLGWLRRPKLDSPQARVLAFLCITWFVPYALSSCGGSRTTSSSGSRPWCRWRFCLL